MEKTEADFASMTVTEVSEGEEWTLAYTLTQEETNRFKTSFPVKIQIRCRFSNGRVAASRIMVARVCDVLNHDFLGA